MSRRGVALSLLLWSFIIIGISASSLSKDGDLGESKARNIRQTEASTTTYFYTYIDDTSMTWEDANYYCQDRWGKVLSIPDVETQNYIVDWIAVQNITGPIYLGIERKPESSGWQFFNGTDVLHDSWAKGEPNDNTTSCAVISADHGYFNWTNYNCSGGAAFICQYDCKRDPFWCVRGEVVHTADTCSCDCDNRWGGPLCDEITLFVKPLYEMGIGKASYFEAEQFCEDKRTTVPSVRTFQLWKALKDFVAKRASLLDKLIYVDLRLVNGVWADSAGNVPEISKWLSGEPQSGEECAVISPADSYRWISVNCSDENKFMCEFQCNKGYENWCIHGDIFVKLGGACDCQCWPGSYGERCEEYDYDDVINKTILFYETQRSGMISQDNRISWRGDSALGDMGYHGEDLTGGWYDAGDHIKVTFKHTASVWKLAWAFLEFKDAYDLAGQTQNFYKSLKWGNDYTMKLHTNRNINSTVFYVHVADPGLDHSYWGRPEQMMMSRPAYPSNTTHPATEVAGNGAASLAASYLVFKDHDPTYAAELLSHARELYEFANQFRGTVEENIPELDFLSGSYGDELTNAALWLYIATNETAYLDAAKSFYVEFGLHKVDALFTRNRIDIALQVKMYLVTGDSQYLTPFTEGLAKWGRSQITYTRKGLAMYTWNRSMKRAADISFLALIAAKHGIQTEEYFEFARSQIHYMLGDGGRSYLTGFGRYPPVRPHHRGSSCPNLPLPCGKDERNSPYPSPQTLYGGLVGGPDDRDNFFDERRNWEQNEAGVNVAAFQGAVAGLSYFRLQETT